MLSIKTANRFFRIASLFFVLSALSIPGATAATFTVDVHTDGVDTNPGDGVCATGFGECTLRAAVMESNALAGADVIELDTGIYQLTVPECGEGTSPAYDDACADLDVTSEITIRGVGAYRTMVSADAYPDIGNGGHFDVSGAGTLQLEDLMLRDADTRGSGGAVRNTGGQLRIYDCVLYGNTASFSGGAIDTRGGAAHIERTLIAFNNASTAFIGGGGIFHSNPSSPGGTALVIIDSTLAFNGALAGSTAPPNNDGKGGGVSLSTNASARLEQVTLYGNKASSFGGGLYAASSIDSLTIISSTFTANRADSDGDAGGGTRGNGGGLASDAAAGVVVRNSILAGNIDDSPPDEIQEPDCYGSINLLSHSLVEELDCSLGTNEDNIFGEDPLLTVYGDRGGPVPTIGFAPTSPAKDAAEGAHCAAFDARGRFRFQGGGCDMGPWESGYAPLFTPKVAGSQPDLSPGDEVCSADFISGLPACTLRAAIQEGSELAAGAPLQTIILLGPSTYFADDGALLSARGEELGTSGDFDVTGQATIIIRGEGARSTSIESSGADRIFDVDPFTDGAALELEELTVRGGSAGSNNSGGNILVRGLGSLTASRVAIENGEAGQGGGVALLAGATALIEESTISGNQAIAGQGDTFGDGAGVYTAGDDLHIINSTIVDNHGEGSGGGVALVEGGYELEYVTIAGNSCDVDGDDEGDGGGIYFAEEEAGVVSNTVIAGNLDVGGGEAPDCIGLTDSTGYNLVGIDGAACGFQSTADQTGTAASPLAAGLGTPADNGGGTDTLEPLAGSPLIDAADPASCPGDDQRGMARPFDGDGDGTARCDIGAVEAGDVGLFADGFESGDTSRWGTVVN